MDKITLLETRTVNIEQDYHQISQWYASHNKPVPPIDWYDGGEGLIVNNIAAVFLYYCKNRVYVEDTISNPLADKGDRHQALDILYYKADKIARQKGMKYIVGLVSDPRVANRVVEHGAHLVKGTFNMILKELS